MFGPATFLFLNEEHELRGPSDWNDPEIEKLWLYNLHYFDDLNAAGAESRKQWHLGLLRRWVLDNPPGFGNGWEPYPISLRIVNWVKWAVRGNELPKDLAQSLAVQSRFLRKRLEYHILGNHLLANAKALIFTGFFFAGPEAREWLLKGFRILGREMDEQILPDGGHFERSPMYHALILEDLLDIAHLTRFYSGESKKVWHGLEEKCHEAIRRMLFWLKAMSHPDGRIVLFNDAAFEIAACLESLESYAKRLIGGTFSKPEEGLFHLPDTGYARVEVGEAVAFLDVAPAGPEYLLGHAHADTLGFELSIFGRRTIVDSGTSCYGGRPERNRQRSTSAHNTVEIDGLDSSEIWGSFRMAKRARPFDLKVRQEEGKVEVSCAHSGYRRLPERPVHRRRWRFGQSELAVEDSIEGGFREALGRFHFHPDVSVSAIDRERGKAVLPDQKTIFWEVSGGEARIESSTYHPEFGKSLANRVLEVRFLGPRATVFFRWN